MSASKDAEIGKVEARNGAHPREEILVFLKYPEPGRVKTRLAKHLGSEEAAGVFSRMARHSVKTVLATCSEARRCTILCDPPARLTDVACWLEDIPAKTHPAFEAQQQGDLGARLEAGFHRAFRRGAQRVIAVGTDCPGITRDLLNRAFAVLEDDDAVLGPAEDGGYYLLGLAHDSSAPFVDVPWSSARTAETTRLRLKQASLNHRELPLLPDLDTGADYERLRPLFPWLAGPAA